MQVPIEGGRSARKTRSRRCGDVQRPPSSNTATEPVPPAGVRWHHRRRLGA
jgi:hypothetical protein